MNKLTTKNEYLNFTIIWYYSPCRIKPKNLILRCCPLFWVWVIITYLYSAVSPHCCRDRYHCRWGKKKTFEVELGSHGLLLSVNNLIVTNQFTNLCTSCCSMDTSDLKSDFTLRNPSSESVFCRPDLKYVPLWWETQQTREPFTCQLIEEHSFSVQWNTAACHLLYPICWQLALPGCSAQPREQTVLQFLLWVE